MSIFGKKEPQAVVHTRVDSVLAAFQETISQLHSVKEHQGNVAADCDADIASLEQTIAQKEAQREEANAEASRAFGLIQKFSELVK